jgi:hypothetical protein
MPDLSTQQLAVFVTSQLLVGKHNPLKRRAGRQQPNGLLISSAQHRGAWEKAFPDHTCDLV